MRSGRHFLSPLLLVPLLVSAMLLSGTGRVLCMGADGRATIEPAGAWFECVSERCGNTESNSAQPVLAGEADCIDLFIGGLQAIRTERPVDRMGGMDLQLLSWLAPDLAQADRLARLFRWSPHLEPPSVQQARSLQSVILLI